MKANELRINNLVKSGKGIYEIYCLFADGTMIINNKGVVISSENTIIKPIPLTEEWLIRFGFEYNEAISVYGCHLK